MYSPVAPVRVLLEMKKLGILPNYLLLLAHDVANNPLDYDRLMGGFEGTIILDNSLIELGKPAESHVIMMAAQVVHPSFVVLPDVLSNAHATLAETKKAIDEWAGRLPAETGFMVVPQGYSYLELVNCARSLLTMVHNAGRKAMFGVPRVITNTLGSRHQALTVFDQFHTPVHLLGMSENFADDMECFKYPFVTGIDSATPIRAGHEGVMYQYEGNGHNAELMDRAEFFETCWSVTDAMRDNMAYVLKRIIYARQ